MVSSSQSGGLLDESERGKQGMREGVRRRPLMRMLLDERTN